MNLVTETAVVGAVTAMLGVPTTTGIVRLTKPKSAYPEKDDFLLMAIGFFITGALVHLLMEWTGGNKWYCKHGLACAK